MASPLTISGGTAEQQLLEVLAGVNALEKSANANPDNANRVNLSFNDDTSTITFSGTLPFSLSVDSTGKPVISAESYLGDV